MYFNVCILIVTVNGKLSHSSNKYTTLSYNDVIRLKYPDYRLCKVISCTPVKTTLLT